MGSAADRFTRLQKISIFLIVMGEEKARQILAGLDLETVEQINAAIESLNEVTPQEKAAVMIEFGDFFYKDKPLASKLEMFSAKSAPPPEPSPPPAPPRQEAPPPPPPQQTSPVSQEKDEASVLNALRQLKQRVDPGQIDWSRAGYDFGEGFKGPRGDRS